MASSLTIAPSLGHSLVTAQGMAGGYDAIDDRSFWQVGLQEGAVGAGDFKVVERGAGANMTVDVACNTGFAVVQGDTVTNQGLYVVRPHTAVANLDIATAHATNPRVDSVVVQVDDDEHDAGGNTRARVMVLTGTATGGATLDNRTGAPALPNSALLLADVLVPATDTTISNTQIRDRRKWARGAYRMIKRVTNAAAGNNYTTTSLTTVEIDATNLKPRVECSGAPIRVTLIGRAQHGTDQQAVIFSIWMDGAQADDSSTGFSASGAAGQFSGVLAQVEFTPSAGSHRFSPAWVVGAGTATLLAQATVAVRFIVEELVRDNTANDITTSG